MGVYLETKHPGYFRDRPGFEMEDLLYAELLKHDLGSWRNAREICLWGCRAFPRTRWGGWGNSGTAEGVVAAEQC